MPDNAATMADAPQSKIDISFLDVVQDVHLVTVRRSGDLELDQRLRQECLRFAAALEKRFTRQLGDSGGFQVQEAEDAFVIAAQHMKVEDLARVMEFSAAYFAARGGQL